MDFMKVLDQAVREIKREVNLKVLKVPEIEQKVLDATNDEAWGPHGSALSEIAQATKKFTECQIVMEVLWSRLTDTGPNWRHVYKALTVIEYLLANGSERAVDDIIEHSFQISSLSSFEFVELSGKDVGINVRKKAETLLGLLNDKEKLQAARNKAAANRDKYVGLSSTGITYKSGSASYGSSQFSSNYSYKDHDQYGDDADWKNEKKDVYEKFQESPPKRGVTKKNRGSTKKPSAVHDASKSKQGNTEDDGFDDFDPRGSSTSDSKSFNQVDLFGDSLIGDLMDAPVASSGSASDDVDLFAGATFVSASPPHPEASKVFEKQDPVDLFGNQTAAPVSSPSNVDLFGASPAAPVSSSSNVDLFAAVPAAPVSSSSNVDPFATTPARSAVSSDPFAAVPLTAFEEPDAFGDFTSHADSLSATAVNPAPKKGAFQVKSGIWADSLSRGLIDLNLTAPKKVSLSDVGVVGGSEEKRPPASAYGGFGSGSGVAQQQPFGGFY